MNHISSSNCISTCLSVYDKKSYMKKVKRNGVLIIINIVSETTAHNH